MINCFLDWLGFQMPPDVNVRKAARIGRLTTGLVQKWNGYRAVTEIFLKTNGGNLAVSSMTHWRTPAAKSNLFFKVGLGDSATGRNIALCKRCCLLQFIGQSHYRKNKTPDWRLQSGVEDYRSFYFLESN
jgi:hypothetical protein